MLPINLPEKHVSWTKDLVSLAAILLCFYAFYLGVHPLFTPDEGRYSEVAREMLATGDYVTPRVNGVAFLDKPVLYYWLQAAAMWAFGVNEWAIRCFPALFGLLGCLMTYVAGRQLFDRRTGLLSAVILATSPLYFGGAHYANLDLEVAVLISCALLCFITAFKQDVPKLSFLLAAYVFAALAFLTKGLIGVVFPIMIVGSWVVLLWRWKILSQAKLVVGLALMAAIILPWYILVQRANPEFLHFFFVTQQFTRFLSAADFNSKSPVWFYAPVVLVGFLPWTLFLFQAMIDSFKTCWQLCKNSNFVIARSPKGDVAIQHLKTGLLRSARNDAQLFLLLWIMIIFTFFSIPHSKLVGYILPIFPPLALLTGRYLSSIWDTKVKKTFLVCTIISTLFLLLLIFSASKLNTNTAKPLTTQLKSMLQPQDEVVNYFKFY